MEIVGLKGFVGRFGGLHLADFGEPVLRAGRTRHVKRSKAPPRRAAEAR